MKIKPGKTVGIKRSIFYSLVSMVTVSILSISIVWYVSEINELKQTVSEMNEKELNDQKSYLRSEVVKAIADIYFLIQFHSDRDEEELKNEILEWLSKKRLIYGGYIFVNKIDGQALIFDGERVDGYKNISDITDPNGLRLFDIEKEAYYAAEGKFMEYLFKPMDSDIPEEKISYVQGFPEWEWIIGAGFYKATPDNYLQNAQMTHYRALKRKLLMIGLISVFLITICYFIVKHIDNMLSSQIALLKNSLKNVVKNNEFINLDEIRFREFNEIGNSINQMIEGKKALTKKIIEKDQDIKAIFSAADNVAFIITGYGDNKSVIKEFSPGAEKLFGYQKSEIIGKDAKILFRPGEHKNYNRVQKLLATGLKRFSGEIGLTGKNKKHFTALFTMHPLTDRNKIKGIITVVIDITKRKEAEVELENLKNSLEQKVEERSREIIAKNRELTEKNKELENYNDLFVGREFRIYELKQKIEELEDKLRQFKN